MSILVNNQKQNHHQNNSKENNGAENSSPNNGAEGNWITINGNHILMK